jgi:hypothetical protein
VYDYNQGKTTGDSSNNEAAKVGKWYGRIPIRQQDQKYHPYRNKPVNEIFN